MSASAHCIGNLVGLLFAWAASLVSLTDHAATSLLLRRWTPSVRSLVHAWRLRAATLTDRVHASEDETAPRDAAQF